MSAVLHRLTQGWLVLVSVVDDRGRRHQHLFIAAFPKADDAKAAVEGKLGCPGDIEIKCRLSARAITKLGLRLGDVQRLDYHELRSE